MTEDICEACGKFKQLIRHHWFDTEFTNEDYSIPRVHNEVDFWVCRNKVLWYHEKKICLKCNRALQQNEIRYFKGGGIAPFKQSDDSHILPKWEIQQSFIRYLIANEQKREKQLLELEQRKNKLLNNIYDSEPIKV